MRTLPSAVVIVSEQSPTFTVIFLHVMQVSSPMLISSWPSSGVALMRILFAQAVVETGQTRSHVNIGGAVAIGRAEAGISRGGGRTAADSVGGNGGEGGIYCGGCWTYVVDGSVMPVENVWPHRSL